MTGKTETGVLIAAAAAVLLFPLLKKVTAAVKVKFNFHSIKSFKFDGFNVILVLEFAIQNPTAETFTVTAVSGNLYLNGSDVGTASNYTSTVVAPQATTIYSIQFTMQSLGIVLELIKRLTGLSGKALTAGFSGRVVVDGYNIPVNDSFSI